MERLTGFRDFFPDPLPASEAWGAATRGHIFDTWRRTALRYGFSEYDGPPLETLELYKLKSGDEIVHQLYWFTDKGDREVALRPEMTPTLARMVAAQARNYRKPLRWFAMPQLFRYERQQKGRMREHFQFNADIVGEENPAADAEIIALLIDTLRAFGLGPDDFVIRLSSRQAWQDFHQRSGAPPETAYAFFQVIDKLEREKPEAVEQRLGELGISRADVDRFLEHGEPSPDLVPILDDLQARGLGAFVRVDYRIVRGLAYYTGPVFEAFDVRGRFRAIAGGGRYDRLIAGLTGGRVDLPALGFGMGDVVLKELLDDRGLLPGPRPGCDVFCLIESDSGRSHALALVQQLRDAGLSVQFPLSASGGGKQFKRATELGAHATVRIEPQPDGTPLAVVRLLATREELRLAPADAAAELKQRLQRGLPGTNETS